MSCYDDILILPFGLDSAFFAVIAILNPGRVGQIGLFWLINFDPAKTTCSCVGHVVVKNGVCVHAHRMF